MNNLLSLLEFSLPTKIVYGTGCIAGLAKELEAVGVSRPLIVTDQGIRQAGILKKAIDLLDQAGINYGIYDGVEANPKDRNVLDGARQARAFKADGLIALGGGSPIDCAKSIGVLLAHDSENIRLFEGKTAATKAQPPLISIPTTAGTGSELTFSSVITNTCEKRKMTIKGPYTAAKIAICDPELTLSVPASVTAATGMDALTHAIEAYTATCSEPISDALALYAIELIYENLPKAVADGSDLSARAAMLMGSMLAGMAFSHSDVASVHCIAESLGSMYDLPHGVCNAIFLPYVMAYNRDYATERYARISQAMGLEFNHVEEGADRAIEAIKQLAQDIWLPSFSSQIDTDDHFEKLAEMSLHNISTESNPRPMSRADYLRVIRQAYED